jgi:hypothetical protein
MKLTELEPQFLRVEIPLKTRRHEDAFAAAQGIRFRCPKCFRANGGLVGTHQVICWFLGRGVDPAEPPTPGRWVATGSGYADLTLSAPSSSIALQGGCAWHGYVQNGEVTDA